MTLLNSFRPGRSDSPVKRVSRVNQDGRFHISYIFCFQSLLMFFSSNRRLPRSRSVPKGTFTFSNTPSPSSSDTTKRGLYPMKLTKQAFSRDLCSSYEQDCAGKEHPPQPEKHKVEGWLDDQLQLQGARRFSKFCTKAQFRQNTKSLSLSSLVGARWRLWASLFANQSPGLSPRAARWESIKCLLILILVSLPSVHCSPVGINHDGLSSLNAKLSV